MIKAVEIEELSFSYTDDKNAVLRDINLRITEGEIVAIVGLSGCGKSTLCNILSGIIPRTIKGNLKGDVRVYGKRISDMTIGELTRTIGIVFQDPDTQIFAPRIIDELAFGMENHCIPVDEMENRIYSVWQELGATLDIHDNPNRLSGGEKQLVVLAAILCLNPRILILDESMSQIDEAGVKMIKSKLLRLKELGITQIIIEHDLNNVDIADRVLYLSDGKLKKYEGELDICL